MIKKLQNNFTTPEQSKRLLELGVPADSADCYTTTNSGRAVVLNLLFSEFMENVVAGGFQNPCAYLPCWSACRLIEIYNTCVDFDLDNGAAIVIFIQDKSPIVQMMEMFEDKVSIMDFSKLEE